MHSQRSIRAAIFIATVVMPWATTEPGAKGSLTNSPVALHQSTWDGSARRNCLVNKEISGFTRLAQNWVLVVRSCGKATPQASTFRRCLLILVVIQRRWLTRGLSASLRSRLTPNRFQLSGNP